MSAPTIVLPPNSTGTAVELRTGADGTSGRQIIGAPLEWSVSSTPSAATAASASKAAGAAGVKHVCRSISATLSTIATAQSTAIVLALRDGATGAGSIIWSKQVTLPANGLWEVNLSNLNIVGTAATAMTLEFTANNATASFSSVAITGYSQAT